MIRPQTYTVPCQTWSFDVRLSTKQQSKESPTTSKQDLGRCREVWKNITDPTANHLQEKAAHFGRVRIPGKGNQRDSSEACHQASLNPHDRRGDLASANCPLTLYACVQVMILRKKYLKGRMGSPGQAKPCLLTKTGQDPTPNTWHKELVSGKRWASPGAVP